MMKLLFALVLGSTLILPLWSQTATKGDVQAMKASMNTSNTHLGRALSQQAQSDLGGKTYGQLVTPSTSDISTVGSTTNEIARAATESQRRYDEGYLILKGNDLLVKGSIGAGIILAPATGGASPLRRQSQKGPPWGSVRQRTLISKQLRIP